MNFRTRYVPFVRDVFDPNIHPDTGEVCESLTRQEHRDECDINSILARYERTGQLPPERQPRYVHCDALTYQDSLDLVIKAQDGFKELPARIRDLYGNSPQRFLEAFDKRDPELIDVCKKYGLITEREPDALALLSEVASNTKPQKPAEKPGAGAPT